MATNYLEAYAHQWDNIGCDDVDTGAEKWVLNQSPANE